LNTQYNVKVVLEKIQCIVKAVLVKLNQEIKELDQLEVYNDLLIKELFIHQYKLCLMYENYLYSITVRD